MPGRRIALGGFMHETNTFAPTKATFDDFHKGGGHLVLSRGTDLIERARGVNLGIAGAIEFGEEAGWELVPVLWAGAVPSAHVEEDAFERIAGELVAGIAAAGPLDGIYLDLHGAMVCEHVDDGEGELLRRLRAVVGPETPIAVSLDLHGNVTRAMVEHADVLVAYRTYPHVDMAETGYRTASQLKRLVDHPQRPAKAFRRIPYLIPISWQCTDMEPCRTIYQRLRELEGGDVDTLSFLPGFPAADFTECGATIVAYGASQEVADRAADEIAALVNASEDAFAGKVYSPDEGVKEAIRIAAGAERPVVIADTQDNPGAGGNSDTTGMLRALVANQASKAAIGVIVDPAAAAAAHRAGEGTTIRLALGGRSGVEGDAPYLADFVVETISDGRLIAKGPFYGGAEMDLGPSACLRIGDVRIVVGSRKAQLADQEMYRFVGIEPREQSILVNKSSVHFRADFAPIAETILVCAAPGPMAVDPASLPWKRLPKGVRLSPNGPVFA
jgi:microcystin degradation protein MlrC